MVQIEKQRRAAEVWRGVYRCAPTHWNGSGNRTSEEMRGTLGTVGALARITGVFEGFSSVPKGANGTLATTRNRPVREMDWRCMRFGAKVVQGKRLERSSPSNEENFAKNSGGVGGHKENPGNYGIVAAVLCPPIGGDKSAVGGVEKLSVVRGRRSESGGQPSTGSAVRQAHRRQAQSRESSFAGVGTRLQQSFDAVLRLDDGTGDFARDEQKGEDEGVGKV